MVELMFVENLGISVNNFHNLKLNFRNLRFRACLKFDDSQGVYADLKEVAMSCLLHRGEAALRNTRAKG